MRLGRAYHRCVIVFLLLVLFYVVFQFLYCHQYPENSLVCILFLYFDQVYNRLFDYSVVKSLFYFEPRRFFASLEPTSIILLN